MHGYFTAPYICSQDYPVRSEFFKQTFEQQRIADGHRPAYHPGCPGLKDRADVFSSFDPSAPFYFKSFDPRQPSQDIQIGRSSKPGPVKVHDVD